MQRLLCLQSMWAMLRRQPGCEEASVEANVARIVAAGYDGISIAFTDRREVREVADCLRPYGKVMEALCFPKTVDELQPVLELAAEFRPLHVNVQPNVRPRRMEDCIPLIEGWQRLAEQSDVPVYFETHRDRMTTDLYFTLDLLDRFPDLRFVADLSHYLVGREFAFPVTDENHALIHRILDHSWAVHGRVASREQVQIEISFPQHGVWLDLFLQWWSYAMRSWRSRASADGVLAFVCELGPPPYAITDRYGHELSDRWEEALLLRDRVRNLWQAQ